MNKRVKKKYRPIKALEQRLSAITTMIDIIINGQSRLYNRIVELEKIVARNAQATNTRFDDLEKKSAAKVSKKSWFSRK